MPLPKPPKLFRSNKETKPAPAAPEETRVWSPTQPPVDDFVKEPEDVAPVGLEQAAVAPEPMAAEPAPTVEEVAPTATEPTDDTAFVAEPPEQPVAPVTPAPAAVPETPVETIAESNSMQSQPQDVAPIVPPQVAKPLAPVSPEPEPKEEDLSRYARPTATPTAIQPEEATQFQPEIIPEEDIQEIDIETKAAEPLQAESDKAAKTDPSEKVDYPDTVMETSSEQILNHTFNAEQKVIRVPSLNSISFSDIWYTAEKIAYIRDSATKFALVPFLSDDLDEFYKALEQGYTGQSSYAIRFAGESYRVERIITLSGAQYNCRKMPGSIPDIRDLGLPSYVVDYLLTLSCESGLILFGGPTGMGKTTSASALMKKFLEMDGGFMYTIEDPPEMPLDGLYKAQNGGLGLCKQCPVDNERWGDGIKSALRSRPRYILVGEIRTPETASQVLRAATSGHLVLSTIHASTVEDALESIIKYASGAGLTEALAADLLARGILAVVHQKLEGVETLHPVLTVAFADPHLTGGDQMRSLIRSNNINLQTLIEAQASRLMQGRPLFTAGKPDANQNPAT